MSFELVDTTNDGEHGQPVPAGVEFEENLVVFDERYLSVVLDFTSQVYGCFESCIIIARLIFLRKINEKV